MLTGAACMEQGGGGAATGEQVAEVPSQLVFGSSITLRLSSSGAVLVANGFADNALSLCSREPDATAADGARGISMRDCVFEVVFPIEYGAAAALTAARLRKDAVDKATLARMHAAMISEHRSNEEAAKHHRGRPVMFGQRIQLRHTISGKYVTARSRVLSKACVAAVVLG